MVAVRAAKPAPTVVARALAELHTAKDGAWAAYDEKAVGTEYGGSLRRPLAERTDANKKAAVSFAAYRVLVNLFPSFVGAFAERMTRLGNDPADLSTSLNTAAGIGNVAAAAVIVARHHDGSNQLGDLHPGAYTDYTGFKPATASRTRRMSRSGQLSKLRRETALQPGCWQRSGGLRSREFGPQPAIER